jgi:hypothetical protein
MSGLLCSDAYSNSTTSYYLKKGDVATFSSPLSIISPDTSNTGLISVANSGAVQISSSNESAIVIGDNSESDGAVLQVNGSAGVGRVYDTLYNPAFTFFNLQSEITGVVAYAQTTTPTAGKYQLQLSIESTIAGDASLSLFAVDLSGAQVLNFSGVQILPSSVGPSLLTMNSGFFSYDAAGPGLRVQITTTGSNWTGTWALQLVKLG